MSTIAIIGGGPSGIVAAKTAIECGLEPVVFEKKSQPGGLWEQKSGFPWESMRTNISHYTCMFSDFAWKEPVDDFPNQKQVFDYLCNYIEAFKLAHCLQLNSEVQKISRFDGKWKVEWISNDVKKDRVFDFVIIASGIFSKAWIPPLPGLKNFKGLILHAKDYKNPALFKDKRVGIVGNAFSGCEIASELSSTAKQIVHIAPKSIWILPRYLSHSTVQGRKIPGDLVFYSRAENMRTKGIPPEEINLRKDAWFRSICKQEKISSQLAVDKNPRNPPFVTISDSYLEKVSCQRIDVKKVSIDHIEEDKLILQDKQVKEVDTLIFCTGYQVDLSFFDQDILDLLEFQPEDKLQPLLLHKTVFPQNALSKIAFVGMYRGPFFGIMELQARWACMAFSGQVPLPSKDEIRLGIDEEKKIREMLPRPQFPHGDYVGLCEDLAAQIGVKPDFKKMRDDNPRLYDQLVNGPFTVASYRLTGFANNSSLALQIIEKINKVLQ